MQFLQTSESFHLFHLFSNIVIIHLKKTFTGFTVLQVVLEVQGQDQICPLKCQICHFLMSTPTPLTGDLDLQGQGQACRGHHLKNHLNY